MIHSGVCHGIQQRHGYLYPGTRRSELPVGRRPCRFCVTCPAFGIGAHQDTSGHIRTRIGLFGVEATGEYHRTLLEVRKTVLGVLACHVRGLISTPY